MIANVTRGSSFGGLQAYLLTGKDGRDVERVSWVTTRHLPSAEPELAAAIMRDTAAESLRTQKPVYHLTISLAPEERLGREAMLRVVDRTLRDIGLEQHQALVVAHSDTRHQHVHVMLNRVHPAERRAWDNRHDYARIERSLRRQERELGLRRVQGRHAAGPDRERHRGVGLSRGSRQFAERTGERPFGEHVREVARQDLREAGSWSELHRRLGEYGLRVEKRGRGLAVTDGQQRVKASFVDRGSSLAKLEARLGAFESAGRDFLAAKDGRWPDIQGLRQAADGLRQRHRADQGLRAERLQRWEARQAQQARARGERKVEVASGRLDERLRHVYREPQQARRAIERAVGQRGSDAVGRELARHPARFGDLRGRGGPMPSTDRKTALAAARPAAGAVRDLALARGELAKLPAPTGKSMVLETVRQAARRPRRSPVRPRADLAKSAGRLVERLGWAMAARVLPAPHYQLVRLTLSLGRGLVQETLGPDRSRAR